MKILVPVKRVIDPNIVPRINDSGSGLLHENLPHTINPFDEVALAKAVDLRDGGLAGEIVAVSIGPQDGAETLRTALAMGAERAVHIVCGKGEILHPFDVARVLAQIYREERADLVLMGKQATDDDAAQTPALLAGFLDLPLLPDSAQIDIAADRITTSFDLGGEEMHAVASLCAIVSCELHVFEPRPVSLMQVMQARRKTIETRELAELLTEPVAGVRRTGLKMPRERAPCRFFETALELVEQMQADGLTK